MNRVVETKSELMQSAISYFSGGSLLGFATLAEIATYAQQIAIILGCLVVAVRLIHDVLNLFRSLKNDKGNENK